MEAEYESRSGRLGDFFCTADSSYDYFQIIALLITLTAGFSYLNYRYIKLSATIGVMLIALLGSLALIGFSFINPWMLEEAEGLLAQIDFDETLMHGMLRFLLFAGALHIDLKDLSKQKGVIALMAFIGLGISVLVFGTLIYYVLGWFGVELCVVPVVWRFDFAD